MLSWEAVSRDSFSSKACTVNEDISSVRVRVCIMLYVRTYVLWIT